jgi:BirA family biotin operon repressor/biotin-[acetyl-CoA-carboxylase] ligase
VLDVTAIERQLPQGSGIGPVRVLGSVTSTNDIAWAWAGAGCPEGAAFFAEEQIQGRGRFGRTWHCPRGTGLLVSVVLRPPDTGITPAHLTALSAVAVAEAVEEVADVHAALRWPNDVTVDDRKVAGVLVERRGRGDNPPCVVGIGLNVNAEPQAFPKEVRETATSLQDATGESLEREAVAATLLRRLHGRYRDCAEGRWDSVSAAWRERSSLVGQKIELRSAGGAACGRVVAVDPLSGIELEMADGEHRRFAAESTSVIDPSRQHTDAHEAIRR